MAGINTDTHNAEYEQVSGLSALDVFLTRVYKFVILAPTSVAAFSAIGYTLTKMLGHLESVSVSALVIFDIVNILFLLVALRFYRVGLNGDTLVKQKQLRTHKIAVGICILIQFNYTIYLIPFDAWWAYAPFFIFFTVFFFDTPLTGWVTAGIMLSTFLSWFISPEIMSKPLGENQLAYLNIKISYLLLSAGLLLSLTHLGRKYLIDELEKYANYDTLTHLLNRKSMDGYMRDAIEKAEKEGSRFCIAMADIDDFKHVNDTYGHDFGDKVLKYVSHTILMGIKKTDSCFRWGGEEICILFTTNMEQAWAASERIMNDISKDSVRYKDKEDVYVTVTIGISEYSDGQTIKSMMEEADARLYWGKRHGKNQVVTHINED